ncbi:hypothetical protein N0V90_009968 [Kalmusia sp. IMI 367209]|nr:hypothetical protein N0V90_009968 [Kalmusia sp. IMI 367209]
MDAPWPEPRANVDASGLKAYTFSATYEILFCGTCSTPMFFADTQDLDKQLGVFTGTIKNDPGDLVKITSHIFVGDTKDGGASMWLRKPNPDRTEVMRYKERAEKENGKPAEALPYDWPPSDYLTGFELKKNVPVPIWCKCKGVNLMWHQGNYNGTTEKQLPWFVDPATRKALGGFCACESCRLFGGVDVWNWAFAELKDISFSDMTQEPRFPDSSTDLQALVDAKDPSIGTLTYYTSSPGVQRFFCSNCSACIFYGADDRSQMVDVAIGVMEASDGARAEGYLSWAYGGAISRLDENTGGWRGDLLSRVAEEGEDWRISRGYPKNWRRLAREGAAKEV